MYNAVVQRKLEYASIILEPIIKKNVMKLEYVQRHSLRFICVKFKSADSSSINTRTNNILQLDKHRRLAWLKFLFLLYNLIIIIDARPHLVPYSPIVIRHCPQQSLTPTFASKNAFKVCLFFSRATTEWNALPTEKFASPNLYRPIDT